MGPSLGLNLVCNLITNICIRYLFAFLGNELTPRVISPFQQAVDYTVLYRLLRSLSIDVPIYGPSTDNPTNMSTFMKNAQGLSYFTFHSYPLSNPLPAKLMCVVSLVFRCNQFLFHRNIDVLRTIKTDILPYWTELKESGKDLPMLITETNSDAATVNVLHIS